MKKCKDCGIEKDISEYHVHKQMKDGHLNKCKVCVRKRVSDHRAKNIDRIRAYDRKRGNRQDKEYLSNYRKKYPNKHKAHNIVNNALRDKKLFKQPCEICGSELNVHAHHDDYLKPLNVRWLCSAHHSQWHAKNGEALNP
tara:strand:- start:80 stop:499 length:420 start_codon:yes stop_codon:yes gene_type:complete